MKTTVLAITGILTFLIGLPMSFAMQYFLYKHVEAPQVVWVLWIIQMPILLTISILNEMAKKMKD